MTRVSAILRPNYRNPETKGVSELFPIQRNQYLPRLQLEAKRQAFESAVQVIWLSDGGRGFWRVDKTCLAHCAIPVLDFFYAAGHLWRATTALFDNPRSSQARAWFHRWRHQLRHGQHHQVLTALTTLINTDALTGKSLSTLLQVQAYFQRHHRHIRRVISF